MKKGYTMYVLFFLVLLTGLFFQTGTAYAAKTADGYEYTADYYAGTCTITAYTGTDTEVVFPSKIDGCKVTAITGNGTRNVFTTQENSTVTSVVVPEGVIEIGPATFYCCYNLKSIKLPRTLEKIGSMAFRSTGIEEITIPGKVKYFGGKAGDPYYESVYGIFDYCSSLKKVVIEKGVEVIGECAFRYCESLETLQLPETLKEIQRDAFRNNKALTSLDLPDSLESIRAGAFVACTELTKITFGSGLKEIGANAFQNDSKIKTLKFGGKVEDIDGYAFGFCTSLVSVDFPASLKSIGNNAFSDCTNLADINFSNGLTSISSEAFKNTALTSIVIPETVIEIRDRAFCDCPNLESAYILNSKIPSLSGFASNTKVTLYGMKDSVIQQYSKNIGVRFTALSLPTDLKAINNNYKSIKLTWSSVNGVNSYNIYRSTSENGTYKKIATISKNSYVDKAVTKAKSYYYKIEVLHKDTDGTVLSGIRTPDVSAGLRPKTPANFEFTRGYYSFSFSWDKVNDADGYIIYRNDIFHRKNIKVAVIKNASTVTFTDKLSYTDTVFEYKIVSYKKVNNELFYSLGNTITDLRTQR